ncbi:MAG: HD domain-containing protein [Nocardioidaceae bacterium]
MADQLIERWNDEFPGRLALGRELVRRYGHITRVYHDLRHLDSVLTHVDLLAGEAKDVRLVRLAAWYHDAVYDVRRDDNEEASADLVMATLPVYDFDDDETAEVARLVLLTSDHAVEPGDRNGAVLCDADLAVLAGSPEEYAAYRDAVRLEYRHVADAAFARGRAAILQGLLDLEYVFATEIGRSRWEQAARRNVSTELDELELDGPAGTA